MLKNNQMRFKSFNKTACAFVLSIMTVLACNSQAQLSADADVLGVYTGLLWQRLTKSWLKKASMLL